MQTAAYPENQTNNLTYTVEDFAQAIHTAEEHLNGVTVETVFTKGKPHPQFKTAGGIRFAYMEMSKDDNPLFLVKHTDADGNTINDAIKTQADIDAIVSALTPLKEAGMLTIRYTNQMADMDHAIFVEMLPAPEDGWESKGLTHWPTPDYNGLNKWQLSSSRDKVLVNGYCLLVNAALRLRSIPYTKAGQEKRKDNKRSRAQHGFIQIIADINGDNRKMSLRRSDGNGINPGFLLTGRGITPNTADNDAHQTLVDSGVRGFPVAQFPGKGNSWRRALDCNARIRQYFVDLQLDAGFPTLVVVDV